jgi:hypothetical protein
VAAGAVRAQAADATHVRGDDDALTKDWAGATAFLGLWQVVEFSDFLHFWKVLPDFATKIPALRPIDSNPYLTCSDVSRQEQAATHPATTGERCKLALKRDNQYPLIFGPSALPA